MANLTTLKELAKNVVANRSVSWFAERVQRARAQGEFAEITTITPEIARAILDQNDGNRKVSDSLVQQIAGDISGGRWQMNGEAIVIAKDGELNDGQHRLNAVIESKTPIRTLMMFGVSRESRYTVDMGRARTTGDFLQMQGVKNWNNAAAITRLYDMYLNKYYSRKGEWQTKQYLLAAYHKNRKAIDHSTTFAQKTFARKVGLPAFGVAYLIIHALNADDCELFFHSFIEGANLKRNSPILALRNRMDLAADQRLAAHERCALILAHWNSWRRGESITRSLPVPRSWPKVER
jgi:hypothetical protein